MLIRNLARILLVTIILCTLLIGVSSAAEPEGKSSNPIFSITPRVWYASMNMNNYNESTISQGTTKSMNMLLYGATLTLSPPVWPQIDFLLTGLHGTADNTGRGVSTAGYTSDWRTNATRTDIELLARYRIKDSPVNVFAGLRYLEYDTDENFITPGFIWTATDSSKRTRERTYWIPEIGVGLTGDITGSGRHRLFGNITLGYAFGKQKVGNPKPSYDGSEDSNDNGVTVDTNVGYELTIIKHLAFHVRYRAFVMKNQDYTDSSSYSVIHGPEAGFKLSF